MKVLNKKQAYERYLNGETVFACPKNLLPFDNGTNNKDYFVQSEQILANGGCNRGDIYKNAFNRYCDTVKVHCNSKNGRTLAYYVND